MLYFHTCDRCLDEAPADYGCGWCSTPLSTGVAYCTTRTNCGAPWRLREQCSATETTATTATTTTTIPEPTTVSPTVAPVDPTPTESGAGRCRVHTSCGACVSTYLCGWCGDAATGYCVGADDDVRVARCAAQGRTPDFNNCAECAGWHECSACRTRGCAWCSSNAANTADYCFNTTHRDPLYACYTQGGSFGGSCPPRHPDLQMGAVDQLPNTTTQTSSKQPSTAPATPDSGFTTSAIIILAVGGVCVGVLALLAIMCCFAGLVETMKDSRQSTQRHDTPMRETRRRRSQDDV